MPSWIDGSLYPDTDVPDEIETLADRVDFLARLCSAWDFGVLPEPETVAEIRRPEWREAADACRLLTSPVYHLVREWPGCRSCNSSGSNWPIFATIRSWLSSESL